MFQRFFARPIFIKSLHQKGAELCIKELTNNKIYRISLDTYFPNTSFKKQHSASWTLLEPQSPPLELNIQFSTELQKHLASQNSSGFIRISTHDIENNRNFIEITHRKWQKLMQTQHLSSAELTLTSDSAETSLLDFEEISTRKIYLERLAEDAKARLKQNTKAPS